jgi:hypothetical protein
MVQYNNLIRVMDNRDYFKKCTILQYLTNRVNLFYSAALTFLFLCGCGGTSEKHKTQCEALPFHIMLETAIDNAMPANLTEIGSSISYIQLETTEKSLLSGYFEIIRATDSHIAIFDRSGVFMFDISGKFISKIGNRGSGPGEYTSVSDLHFSLDGQKVYLMVSGAKCFEYDVNGSFLNSFSLDNPQIQLMMPLADNLFVFHQRNVLKNVEHSLSISDLQGNITKMYDNHHKITSDRPMSDWQIKPLYSHQGNVRFKQRGDRADTLFTVTEKELTPYAIFNLGKYAMPIDISQPAQRMSYDELLLYLGADGKFYVREMKEDSDNIYVTLFDYHMLEGFVPRYQYGFFSKHNCTTKVIGGQGFQNNIDGGLHFFPKFVYGDILIDYVSAFDLREHVKNSNAAEMKRRYNNNYDDLVKLANNLEDDSNQIVVLVKK